MKLTTLTLACLICGMLAAAAPAAPTPEKIEVGNMKHEMSKVAQKLLDIAEGENQATLAIGQFAAAGPDMNFGAGFEEMLSAALEALRSGVVQRSAGLSISGKYRRMDQGTRTTVHLEIEVALRNGAPVNTFVAELTGNSDIAVVLGVTTSLPIDEGKAERNEKLKERADAPQVFIDGPLVRAAPNSPLAVEIRSKLVDSSDAYSPRLPKSLEGTAFVPIGKGELYEIVLHNKGDREVAAAVTVDGLSVFTFSEVLDPKSKQPAYSHYVIGAGKTARIVGWHLRDKTPDNYSSFLVTELGKGASAKAAKPSQGKTGVVSVAFSFTGPVGSRGTETGFGPPQSIQVEPVARGIDAAHEFVTIRYDK